MKRSIFGLNNAHPDISKSLSNLGEALRHIGHPRKALTLFQQSLEMQRSIYGESTSHPDIAGSLSNLGTTWRALGNDRKAIVFFEQSLHNIMYSSIYGIDTAHHHIANSLNNLGAAWSDLGDYEKAVMYFEQSYQMRRIVYENYPAHPDLAQSLVDLSIACEQRYNKTFNMYLERLLRMRQASSGVRKEL